MESAVRPAMIVIQTAAFDHAPGLGDRLENFAAQALVTKVSLESFDIASFSRTPKFDT